MDDIFATLLNDIMEARIIFDNTDRDTRYKTLYPIFLNIDKCMKYIRNNEEYNKYILFLETLRAII